ncbi:MAG: hypothetical protein ACI81L_002956 [Verrucomicrobiales bacterium]|jgi:hypothetical protein
MRVDECSPESDDGLKETGGIKMKLHPRRVNRRRMFVPLLAGGLLLSGINAAPAAADSDEVVTNESFTDVFMSENPCTGELHEITIHIEAEIEERSDEIRIEADRTGTTDDGFVLDDGEEKLRFDGDFNILRAELKDEWEHADGSTFTAEGRFRIDADTGEVTRDEFSLTCGD